MPVWVEVDIARGLPYFNLVGLPDSSVRESRERVRSALRNSGFTFPVARITVNLAPGNIRKVGSAYDLPIALGILAAQGLIPTDALNHWVVLGELALDGRVRPVRGALCTAVDLLGHPQDKTSLLLPAKNAHEIKLLTGVRSATATSLQQAVQLVRRGAQALPEPSLQPSIPLDLGDIQDPVIGHEAAKRALEIAVAGGHNALMIGPPGSGKTLLSARIQHILPTLTPTEAIEVNRVYSAAGLLEGSTSLHTSPPVRAPHHTITTGAMIGGGNPVVPGEISLAHRGILLLDELAQFRRSTLEALREPLEQGFIRITRTGVTTVLPSKVSLIAATNPCPCGWLGDTKSDCTCTPAEIVRYRRKLSGPLLDRIDLVIEVGRSPVAELTGNNKAAKGASLLATRQRIIVARQYQQQRNTAEELNAHNEGLTLEAVAALPTPSRRLVVRATERYALTGRGLHRLMRVARTIADLAESVTIEPEHVAEALAYRMPPDMAASESS